ncbi:class I SAM-dependent methyltransferase [Weissella paramesenteroides]|uniref:class I SAM-dependent methyltransferase n=1 Tax=Weissella paramesenteroides TaxID=1249 RepID=UPI00388F39B4
MSNTQAVNENLENWDDRANIHAHGAYGDLNKFANNSQAITGTVRRDLDVLKPFLPERSVAGQRLLHLQCHIGNDTLSWQRLGAKEVYGLDFSPKSLEYANDLANLAGAKITYVQGDARYASKALSNKHGQFDVVVTSAGTITWLPDLSDWAQSIADLLAPEGIFMIRDNHPMLFVLDNDGLEVKQNYFSGTEVSYESDNSYVVNDADNQQHIIEHTKNHNWAHDFQEIISVLRAAGLTIEAVGEYAKTDWQALPMLTYNEVNDEWIMPEGYPQLPLTFSVVARKI